MRRLPHLVFVYALIACTPDAADPPTGTADAVTPVLDAVSPAPDAVDAVDARSIADTTPLPVDAARAAADSTVDAAPVRDGLIPVADLGSVGPDAQGITADAASVPSDAVIDAVPSPADAGPPAMATPFDLRVGGATAGDHRACDPGFGTLAPEDFEVPNPVTFLVDPDAADGGDGSGDRPFQSPARAVAASAGRPLVLLLAPGRYVGPIASASPLAIAGPCAERVTLEGDVSLTGQGPHAVSGVTLHGGLSVEGATRAVVADTRVETDGEVALTLTSVAAAEVRDSRLSGASRVQIRATESRAYLQRTVVGPGQGGGIRLRADPERVLDECGPASPECPFGGLLVLSESLVADVRGRGLDATHGRLMVLRSRVAGVTRADPALAAVGVGLTYGFGALADSSVVEDVEGIGLLSESSRLLLRDMAVRGATDGGVRVRRVAWGSGESLRVGSDWHPGWEWSPPPEPLPGAWHPGWEWQPRDETLPVEGLLPPALRSGAAVPAPEATLHRWARTHVTDVDVEGCGGFGVRASDHLVDATHLQVAGTLGADSTAVWFEQGAPAPLEQENTSFVVLSRLDTLTLRDNAGYGFLASGTLLKGLDAAGNTVAWVTRGDENAERSVGRLRVESLSVDSPGGPGVVGHAAGLDLRTLTVARAGGVALWSIGANLRVRSGTLQNTTPAMLTGRAGVVMAADGFVADTAVGDDSAFAALDATGLAVADMGRVGALMVNDLRPLRGRVEVVNAVGNALDAAALAPLDGLAVEQVQTQVVGEDVLPPPTLPPGL